MAVEVESTPRHAVRELAIVRRGSRRFAKWMRWLHIYLSMISFSVVLFFSVTGVTLNHPTWFGGDYESLRESTGKLDSGLLSASAVSRLETVEYLRDREKIRGAVGEFTSDEFQVIVTFRAPAYSADVFIDRESGEYELVESSLGIVALFNDLHKGRDTGESWSLIIDLSALLMIVVSATGLTLIFYIKRHRVAGLAVCALGVVVSVVAYVLLAPH